MNEASKEQTDLTAISEDMAALKHDFANLLEHLKRSGIDTAQDAMSSLSDETQRLYQGLATESERSIKALSRRVEEHPLTSLVIAFGLGLISGRFLSR